MENQEKASIIRKKVGQLKLRRAKLEKELLKRRRMIPACLVKRYLGTSRAKRQKPYWYLSRAVKGKTVLKYVKMEELDKISNKTRQWKEFSSSLSEWRKISKQIEKLLGQLGQLQSEGYNGQKAEG